MEVYLTYENDTWKLKKKTGEVLKTYNCAVEAEEDLRKIYRRAERRKKPEHDEV